MDTELKSGGATAKYRTNVKDRDAEAGRRKREENAVSLRRERRDELMAKKRRCAVDDDTAASAAGAASAPVAAVPAEIHPRHLPAFVHGESNGLRPPRDVCAPPAPQRPTKLPHRCVRTRRRVVRARGVAARPSSAVPRS